MASNYPNYWGPGSGSSGYRAGADVLTTSPFDSTYWDKTQTTKYDQDQGNAVRIGSDGLAYRAGTTARYTGKDPITGKYYEDGAERVLVPGSSGTYINPNDVNQRYKATSVIKDSGVNSAAQAQLDELNKNMQEIGKSLDFSTHLKDFQTDLGTARTATAKATDIGGTEAALRGYQQKYSGDLDTSKREYADLNAGNDARQRAILAQYQDTIPQYDVAAQNAADRAAAGAVQQWSKMRIAGSTPGSMDTNSQAILANNLADIQLPTQLAKIKAQQDYYSNLALPTEQRLYGNEQQRIAQFNPEIARQQFSSGQATEQTIQGLRQQVASMSTSAATQFMQSLGVPYQLQQQILSGQSQNLGQIAALRSGSEYQGLQDLLGANLSQPQYYNLNTGGYPTYPGSVPSNPMASGDPYATSTGSGGAPTVVNPSTGGIAYRPIAVADNSKRYPSYYPTNPYGTGYPHSYFDDQGLPIEASGID